MRRAVNERMAACKQLLFYVCMCVRGVCVCTLESYIENSLRALAYLLPSCVRTNDERVRYAALRCDCNSHSAGNKLTR